MKLIIGQHGEFGWLRGQPVPVREIEVEEDERLAIIVRDKNTGEQQEVVSFFMPGVLHIEWEEGSCRLKSRSSVGVN